MTFILLSHSSFIPSPGDYSSCSPPLFPLVLSCTCVFVVLEPRFLCTYSFLSGFSRFASLCYGFHWVSFVFCMVYLFVCCRISFFLIVPSFSLLPLSLSGFVLFLTVHVHFLDSGSALSLVPFSLSQFSHAVSLFSLCLPLSTATFSSWFCTLHSLSFSAPLTVLSAPAGFLLHSRHFYVTLHSFMVIPVPTLFLTPFIHSHSLLTMEFDLHSMT